MLFHLESRDFRWFSGDLQGGSVACAITHSPQHSLRHVRARLKTSLRDNKLTVLPRRSSLIYRTVRESLEEGPDWESCAHIPAETRAAAGRGRDERTKKKRRNDLEEVINRHDLEDFMYYWQGRHSLQGLISDGHQVAARCHGFLLILSQTQLPFTFHKLYSMIAGQR